MDIKVLDKNYKVVALVDAVDSFIWTDRYNSFGEFEIYTPVTAEFLSVFQIDRYLEIDDSDRTMIIESQEIKSDVEVGNKLIVKGRSLETLLERRVVFHQTLYVAEELQNIFSDLLDRNFINPESSNGFQDPADPFKRKMPNMTWLENSDTRLDGILVDKQYYSETIYKIFEDLTKEHDLGFKVVLNDSNQFVMSIYLGEDRSYAQTTNPFVVFSPAFDNLDNSFYVKSKRRFKNFARILSFIYDTGALHVQSIVPGTVDPTGINNREVFIDLQDEISRYVLGTTTLIDTDEYNEQVKSKAREILKNELGIVTFFDGVADVTTTYKYGVDFFLGDIVQLEDEYGHVGRSQITEIIISEDVSGFVIIPTFTPIDDEE